MQDHSERSCVIILADGARADTFERLLAAGELPAIAEHVVERGSYRRAASAFTSTTGPAHIPLLTGCFPGTANVPGYRWFDRERYRGFGPAGPRALRSYNGPEASWFGSDMGAGCRTLFELVPGSLGIYGVITRGLGRGANLNGLRKSPLWAHAHYMHDYERADRSAAAALLRSLRRPARLRFAAFPGIDWNCHYRGLDCPAAIAAYHRIDDVVAALAERLHDDGTYDSTLIAVVSDHGHSAVEHHFDLPVELARRPGMRVAYHSLPALRPRFNAVAAVSGNGMAQIYLRGRHGWRDRPGRAEIADLAPGLLPWLLEQPAVDLVVTRAAARGQLLIEGRGGIAELRAQGRGAGLELAYEPLAGDPLGWDGSPRLLASDAALALDFDGPRPDVLAQIAQLFRAPRCGDIVVSAAPGYDLRDRFERPEHRSSHGALHREHMLVPLASSARLDAGPVRTADLAPTVLDYLGCPVPAGLDGSSRLRSTASTAPRAEAPAVTVTAST